MTKPDTSEACRDCSVIFGPSPQWVHYKRDVYRDDWPFCERCHMPAPVKTDAHA